MCSQKGYDEGEGSDRWDWADYFFGGHSHLELQEPEVTVNNGSANSDVDAEVNHGDADESLFPGCPLTLNLSAVLVMELLVRHNLSENC